MTIIDHRMSTTLLTIVRVSGKIICINDAIMISIQVPKLAIDDIEMFVGKVFQFLSKWNKRFKNP